MPIFIERIDKLPSFNNFCQGWWGYSVHIDGLLPFDFWVLGADYNDIGDGFIQREAVDERMADGRSPFECHEPHPDIYYDEVWNEIIKDLNNYDRLSL